MARAQQGLAEQRPWALLRGELKGVSDVERITARIALRQVRPRELVALCKTLHKSRAACAAPAAPEPSSVPDLQPPACRPRAAPHCCCAAIDEEPAALVRDGGVIATGFDAELDELRAIQTNCDAFLLDLETREKARTGIANLRVQFNRVHGFYIEVTQASSTRCPTTTAAARR